MPFRFQSVVLVMASAFTLMAGLGVSAVLLSSAWTDVTGDTGYRAAFRTYRLSASFAPDFAASATLPEFSYYQFSARTLERIRSDVVGVEDALLVTESAPVRLLGDEDGSVRLKTIASSGRFFDFFSAGGRGGEVGVWLTQAGADRLRQQAGGLPPEVTVARQYYSVLGVIADPPAGSHLQYDALVVSPPFRPAREGVIYIRTSSPGEVERQLSGYLADDIGIPPRAIQARLAPITGLRIGARPAFGDASFIVTGQGLELAVALFCGLSALVGSALAVSLLTSGWIATNREKLGILVMLGAAPKRIALKILFLLTVIAALLALAAFASSVAFGAPLLEALNKPDPTELLQPVAAAFGLGLVSILFFAGLSLVPLATEPPARLALSGPGRRREAVIILVIGLAILSTASASLGFVAAQFSLEARRGANLGLDDSRTWRIATYDRALIGRAIEAAEGSRLVDRYTVLNWYPFSDTSLNMPVSLEGGPLVQASVLTGEMSWPHFVDAGVLAGVVPRRLWGAGRHCEAVLESTAADQISPLTYQSQIGRNIFLANGVESCRIVAITQPVRRGKLAAHGDPVVHLVGADHATIGNREGEGYLIFLARLKPGIMPTDVFDEEVLSGQGMQIVSLAEMGQAAYERERRVASILNLASFVLVVVFFSVSLALSLQTFAASRRQFAIRVALGIRPSSLASRMLFPVFLSAIASFISTSILTLLINRSWSSWGGLSQIDPVTGLIALGKASVLCVLPVVLVAVVSISLISRLSPATILRQG